MTIAGGIGHTLPYLIPDFWTATGVAGVVVVFELLTIAWIQWRYMDTSPLSAAAKVMLGGAIVLGIGKTASARHKLHCGLVAPGSPCCKRSSQ